MATAWRFVVPLPGELWTGNSRGHWRVRAGMVAQLRGTVALIALSERRKAGLPEATERRRIVLTLVRGKGQRTLDLDNAYHACKPACDAVVAAGWAVSDSPRWLDYAVRQRKDQGSPRLEVEVSPCSC